MIDSEVISNYGYGAAVLGALVEGDGVAILSGVEYSVDGSGRLAGGLTPVALGFQASLVLIIAVSNIRQSTGSRRVPPAAVAVLGVVVITASSSRAAIVALIVAVIVMIVFRARAFAKVVGALVASALVVAYLWLLEPLLLALGASQASIDTATGRFAIWDAIVTHNQHWFIGNGFASMRYADSGPDSDLFAATGYLPSENALLQALVSGGILAGVLWLAIAAVVGLRLWRARYHTKGLSVAVGVVLVANAAFSVGQSGYALAWWWLLASGSASVLALRPSASGHQTFPRQPAFKALHS